jgi:CheY-like chemotaxis protein
MTDSTNHYNPKVLVVDDEPIIADTLTMILATSGYDSRPAYSGEMALEMARSFKPDPLITDVVMPGISGIEAATKIRELLAKPIEPVDLIAKMQSVVNG